MITRDFLADERAEALQEFVDSPTWREIMRPALQRRSVALATQIAGSRNSDFEQIRWWQAEWAMLQTIVDDTKRFFSEE